MKTKATHFIGALLLAVAAFGFGCNDEETSEQTEPNQVENTQTNFVPTTLAGKSYSFTVTASQNFAEPFSSDYTIDFNSDTSYTLHPNSQRTEAAEDSEGNYTYDFHSGIIHFVETRPVSGRVIDAVLTFTSATTGTAHLTGRNSESQDAIFIQTSP
jgi:hypothetical protein